MRLPANPQNRPAGRYLTLTGNGNPGFRRLANLIERRKLAPGGRLARKGYQEEAVIENQETYYLDKLNEYAVEADTARQLVEQVTAAVARKELARFTIELNGQVPVLAFYIEKEAAPAAKNGGLQPEVYAIYCVPENDREVRLRCDLHMGNQRMYVFAVLTEAEYAARQDAQH